MRPLLALAVVATFSSVAVVARADDQALVRVIAEAASVRTGPGFGYRTVYRANQGEVLTVIGRATHDHWFRVELPDGTYGWILGDEVYDANRTLFKALAYRAYGQYRAYWPDSSVTSRDKKNVLEFMRLFHRRVC